MNEENLTPEESLKIIDKAISNFKVNYRESSQVFLLFGWLLALASLSNFIVLKVLHAKEAYDLTGPLTFSIWGAFAVIGFIALFFIVQREKKHKKVYSYIDGYVNKLWWVTLIAFFVGVFLCIKLGIAPPPIMMLIAGIATATTGFLIKFRPLIIGGMVFFISSIVTVFVMNEYSALVVCAAIICGYIIPGYMLKSAKE
jgi:NAD/NADP transhydrogenase beta subunit